MYKNEYWLDLEPIIMNEQDNIVLTKKKEVCYQIYTTNTIFFFLLNDKSRLNLNHVTLFHTPILSIFFIRLILSFYRGEIALNLIVITYTIFTNCMTFHADNCDLNSCFGTGCLMSKTRFVRTKATRRLLRKESKHPTLTKILRNFLLVHVRILFC